MGIMKSDIVIDCNITSVKKMGYFQIGKKNGRKKLLRTKLAFWVSCHVFGCI